jgi:hypothetical protein
MALLIHYGWIALEVIGVTFVVIAIGLWINWLRLGKPKPPDDFK